MFTGIIKSVCFVTQVIERAEELKNRQTDIKIEVERPVGPAFAGLKTGDSVAVDGVCLTLEQISPKKMSFHIGYETLKITGWNKQKLENKKVNIEPALKAQDFVGGHFVSGHVDGMAEVADIKTKGECLLMELKIPLEFKNYFWKKAFIALNGASLTINKLKKDRIFLCLVPETLKNSNLSDQKPGSLLTFELDPLARAIQAQLKNIDFQAQK